ncbi:hypothetical protein DET55_10791 [Bacillus mycoides]|uniref:Uncharacterized protein n=1 Tax=Bacillus mycoides TaxID=1405 RepID=A0A3D9VAN7_BACMY|nr:hypothetical protein DET63_102384 [Bacillus sp. DB-2]REF38852.1 hypothetical protein DET55_10791 [Bacillus mycoides]
MCPFNCHKNKTILSDMENMIHLAELFMLIEAKEIFEFQFLYLLTSVRKDDILTIVGIPSATLPH